MILIEQLFSRRLPASIVGARYAGKEVLVCAVLRIEIPGLNRCLLTGLDLNHMAVPELVAPAR